MTGLLMRALGNPVILVNARSDKIMVSEYCRQRFFEGEAVFIKW
jgi:hypothetical protein